MDQPSASSDRSDERIGTAEAARRLGVKRETLYAYVSRGLLASNRGSGRSGSTFSLTEVEALRRSGARVRGASTRPFRFPAVTTNITAVTENHLRYRGHDATRLARTATFEAVAQLLWTGVLRDQPIVAPARVLRETRALTGALPGTVDPLSRLRVAVCVAGAMDPLRFDISPPAVRRSATTALACMAGALRTVETGPEQGARLAEAAAAAGEVGIARRLWLALAPGRPREDLLRCLNAALVLVADRGLAASTVAARVAASAHANPYAVISAGLASLEGPLHGAASSEAHGLLLDIVRGQDVEVVAARRLRRGGDVPGVRSGPPDPRAYALLELLRPCPAAQVALACVERITTSLDRGDGLHPTIELAIGALAVASGMPLGAGEAIFATGRSAGWVAHALEEYAEEPMRWRAQEIYTGPA